MIRKIWTFSAVYVHFIWSCLILLEGFFLLNFRTENKGALELLNLYRWTYVRFVGVHSQFHMHRASLLVERFELLAFSIAACYGNGGRYFFWRNPGQPINLLHESFTQIFCYSSMHALVPHFKFESLVFLQCGSDFVCLYNKKLQFFYLLISRKKNQCTSEKYQCTWEHVVLCLARFTGLFWKHV